MRSIGFPWSEGLVRRARASAGGTLAATRALLEWQLPITANIAGKGLYNFKKSCKMLSQLHG